MSRPRATTAAPAPGRRAVEAPPGGCQNRLAPPSAGEPPVPAAPREEAVVALVTTPRPPALSPDPSAPVRLLRTPALMLDGRGAIEGYLERLNLASPVAERRITRWGPEPDERLCVGAVMHTLGAHGANDAFPAEVFMGECRFSFGLDLRTRNPAAAPSAYAIGLPLTGDMSVTIGGAEVAARAGEGVIIDPAEVERTQVSGGSHFVEFHLPRSEVLRLASAWTPALDGRAPRFAPHLDATLAPRLLFMATQAAGVLESPGNPAGARMLFQRWTEMIALTLLHEQRIDNPLARRPGAGAPAPASIRRAIDFIQAHADGAIGLADIAEAACISASSLLRHFHSHIGMSPYAFLRVVRLERARAELQRDTPGAIRDVALRWGFQNASKFSRAYQEQYGERPSDTRERHAR
jgi:AraC-like DNA-binding protein